MYIGREKENDVSYLRFRHFRKYYISEVLISLRVEEGF